MKGGYVAWQFWYGPTWLLEFAWNLQRANFRLFSVTIMLKTFFSHWHRDVLPYSGGSLTQHLTTFALNQISRAIGMIIRTAALIAWMFSTIFLFLSSFATIVFFLLWPIIPLVFIIAGGIVMGSGI